MLTSKQLIEITGISRATMNNYVAQGLLPRPDVKKPEGGGERARQLGYFPDDAVDRVAEIQDLKRQGLTMGQIVVRLVGGAAVVTEKPAAVTAPASETKAVPAPALTTVPTPDGGVRLTLDDLDQPAYMVNYNFHVEWSNRAATRDLFGIDDRLEPEIDARSLFKLVLNSPTARSWVDRSTLLAFQLSIAKVRLPKQSLGGLGAEVSAADLEILGSLYDETTPARPGMLCEVHLNLAASDDEPRWHTVFASFFREGILFVHQAADTPAETFLELLSRRDHLIRSVVKSRHLSHGDQRRIHGAWRHHQPRWPAQRLRALRVGLGDQEPDRQADTGGAPEHPLRYPPDQCRGPRNVDSSHLFATLESDRPEQREVREVPRHRHPSHRRSDGDSQGGEMTCHRENWAGGPANDQQKTG